MAATLKWRQWRRILTQGARTAGRCPRPGNLRALTAQRARGQWTESGRVYFLFTHVHTHRSQASRSVGNWGRVSISAQQWIEAAPRLIVGVDGPVERTVVHVLPPYGNHVTVSGRANVAALIFSHQGSVAPRLDIVDPLLPTKSPPYSSSSPVTLYSPVKGCCLPATF